MADYSKIQEQIDAVKAAQVKAELNMMAEANARLEAARVENEKRRIAAEKAQEEATKAHMEKRARAASLAMELERAEQARQRAEEHKINLAMEAKMQEEREAEALKKKLLDLQFQQEQALKKLRDSYDMAAASELASFDSSVSQKVAPDGSVLKPVMANVDGTVNPLKQHLHEVNN